MQTVVNNLQEAIEKLFQWFPGNYLRANAEKCHLLTSSKTAVFIYQMSSMYIEDIGAVLAQKSYKINRQY